jgi:hypothetical protein
MGTPCVGNARKITSLGHPPAQPCALDRSSYSRRAQGKSAAEANYSYFTKKVGRNWGQTGALHPSVPGVPPDVGSDRDESKLERHPRCHIEGAGLPVSPSRESPLERTWEGAVP